MKTLFSLIIAVIFSVSAQAQQSAKVTISTPTVHCEECKNRIIKYVSRDLGVQKVEVDWRKGITKVQYIPHRINPETIRVNIANLGYDADDEERLEEAFKKLPKACQIDRKKP